MCVKHAGSLKVLGPRYVVRDCGSRSQSASIQVCCSCDCGTISTYQHGNLRVPPQSQWLIVPKLGLISWGGGIGWVPLDSHDINSILGSRSYFIGHVHQHMTWMRCPDRIFGIHHHHNETLSHYLQRIIAAFRNKYPREFQLKIIPPILGDIPILIHRL